MRDDDGDEIGRIGKSYEQPPKATVGIEHRHDRFLPIPSVLAGVGVAMGLSAALPGEGVAHNFNVLMGGISVFALSLFANKGLFHTGSKLAAAGDHFTIGVACAWFTTMAAMVGTMGFTGLTHEITSGARLRAPVVAMTEASRSVGQDAASAKRLMPLVTAGKSDMSGLESCEISGGCVSGRKGRGTTASQLRALSEKFAAIERQYVAADRKRSELSAKLEGLVGEYEATLGRYGGSTEGRARLLAIYAKAQSLATEIGNVMPTAAVEGLIGDLRRMQSGGRNKGPVDLVARVRSHADQLEGALGNIKSGGANLPPFPERPGIASGWERLDLTWPLAILLFGIEGVLLVLWLVLVRDIAVQLAARRGRDRPENHDSTDGPSGPAPTTAGRRGPARLRNEQMIGRSNGAAS